MWDPCVTAGWGQTQSMGGISCPESIQGSTDRETSRKTSWDDCTPGFLLLAPNPSLAEDTRQRPLPAQGPGSTRGARDGHVAKRLGWKNSLYHPRALINISQLTVTRTAGSVAVLQLMGITQHQRVPWADLPSELQFYISSGFTHFTLST